MNIGFTFDEKVFLKADYRDCLRRASLLGASSIELALDPDIISLEQSLDIASTCFSLGMGINYHIPYFISDSYSIANFDAGKRESLQKYNDFLCNIESIYKVNKSRGTIVVHGEEFGHLAKKTYQGSISFLRFLIAELERRELPHTVSVETLRLGEFSKVGDSRSDLLYMLDEIKSDRLGICLDICHDSMNYFPLEAPSNTEFLSKVNYAHIHGFNLYKCQNHTSLSESSLNFLNQAVLLRAIKPDITLSIESLSDFVGKTYLDSLFRDIRLLQAIR